MDWDVIAPMIVAVTLIVTVGGVAILRPIAKRLAHLLETYASERQSGLEGDVQRMREILEMVSARLQLLEERQDFTERLLDSGERSQARREGVHRGGEDPTG